MVHVTSMRSMYDASGVQAITVDHLPGTYRSYMPSTVRNSAEVVGSRVRRFEASLATGVR
jgi:hypothetical protein